MGDPRPGALNFATSVSNMYISIHMDRMSAFRPQRGQRGPCSDSLRGNGRRLEKLEKAPWLRPAHGRAERGAHPNLIEINAFAVWAAFEYGSTSIMETL
jgi:hypothetical protein